MDLGVALKEYGLSDKEVKVYLALLSSGEASASEIAKKSSVLRETTYKVLESLIQKRLVSVAIKSNIKKFMANNPHSLIDELKKKEAVIEQVMHNLNRKYKSESENIHVEVYEGKQGLSKQFYSISDNAEKDILGILNTDMAFKLLPFQPNKAATLRMEKGVRSKMILDKGERLEEIQRRNKKELRKTISKEWASKIKMALYIHENSISIMSFNEENPNGVTITDENIADSFRVIFRELSNT